MCEPASIALTMAVVSTVSQGYAAKQQGKHAKGVAKYNARVKENEATLTRTKGVEEENAARQRTAQLLSKQRAQLGAANVDLTSGSPLDLQEDTVLLGEVDALRIKGNFQRGAGSLEQQAELTRAGGAAAEAGGKSAFGASLLSAGGQVAGKWYTPDSAGATSTIGGRSVDFSNVKSTTRPSTSVGIF
jgi:hypothetical protein